VAKAELVTCHLCIPPRASWHYSLGQNICYYHKRVHYLCPFCIEFINIRWQGHLADKGEGQSAHLQGTLWC